MGGEWTNSAFGKTQTSETMVSFSGATAASHAGFKRLNFLSAPGRFSYGGAFTLGAASKDV